MVVRIRLARGGQRNRAFYRIVAADARAPRDGRFIEILGAYDPLPPSSQEATRGIKRVLLNVERIKYWLSVGAQPSDPGVLLLLLDAASSSYLLPYLLTPPFLWYHFDVIRHAKSPAFLAQQESSHSLRAEPAIRRFRVRMHLQ